jgi:hypothetical protein
VDPREVRFYALCEPDADHIRYVGQTAYSLRARFRRHMRSTTVASGEWIQSLKSKGLRPRLVLLETLTLGSRDIARREFAWMRACIDAGHQLLNDPLPPPEKQDPEVTALFAGIADNLPFATPEQMKDGKSYPRGLPRRRARTDMGPDITHAEIDALRTPRSGKVRDRQLRAWGVPIPPPLGWEDHLVEHGVPYKLDV